MRDSDPITRLTAARFDGPQALYTEAVRLLSEQPALPDDLAGLVDAGRRMSPRLDLLDCETVLQMADAIEALVAEREAAIARAERAEAALAVAEEGLRVIALCVLSLSAGADAENRRHAGFVLAQIAALKGGAE